MSVPREVLIAIGRAVWEAGGDMDDVDDLVAVWQRLDADSRGRVDRLRAQAARPVCSCAHDDEIGSDGRCRRCWGWEQ